MIISENEYKKMPKRLRVMLNKLPNPGSPEVLGLFPEQKSGAMHGIYKNTIMKGRPGIRDGNETLLHQEASSGSAARFFYCAKASKKDRGRGNNHPTVKPVDLIRYLCRLVTPPGGAVLDPFFGSGTMGKAAILERFRFIGIEQGLKNCETAVKRIKNYWQTDYGSEELKGSKLKGLKL